MNAIEPTQTIDADVTTDIATNSSIEREVNCLMQIEKAKLAKVSARNSLNLIA